LLSRWPKKALKAFMYAQGEEFVISHSVEALCRWVVEFDADSEPLREAVSPLDGYHIPTRYPNGHPDFVPAGMYTRRAAEETLETCGRVLRVVSQKLDKS
jgi:HEPN domain-containing protein